MYNLCGMDGGGDICNIELIYNMLCENISSTNISARMRRIGVTVDKCQVEDVRSF